MRFYPLVKGFIITSPFGPRDGDFHYGTDFGWNGGSAGLPVYACQSGTVIYDGPADGYGGPDPAGWIVIDSDDSQGSGCLEYGHIIREVKAGDNVTAGQRIGHINPDWNTNGNVAPHLHLAVHSYDLDSDYLNPADWLKTAQYIGGETLPAPEVVVANKPAYKVIDMYGPSYSSRWGARISNIYGHTQEARNYPDAAVGLAGYTNNPNNGASYHILIANGIVVNTVNIDFASWSVLDANASSINICFAGTSASMSRQEWLARENDVRIFAWIAVELCRKKGIATNVIAPPYKRQDGISDHKYVTQVLGMGTHTDLGPNFIWDRLAAFVREYLSGAAPRPVVNMIDEEAKRASWIGKATDIEKPCPDGRGKYRPYENGVIYWTPTTGAHAIPARLFETYKRYGFERSFLGYPIGDHTVLKDKDGKILGGVQGFEGGATYRREGDDPGYAVSGDIRNMWNRSGFENGPYGWPTGDEVEIVPGVKIQDFQNARLLWAPGKVIALKPTDGVDKVLPVF